MKVHLLFQHQAETGSAVLLHVYADKKVADRKCAYLNRHQNALTSYHVKTYEVLTKYNRNDL